jgi:hypothetical protein
MDDAQSPVVVTCEPDSGPDLNDGMYVTYEYLGQLIRRAQHVMHCQTCTCGQ